MAGFAQSSLRAASELCSLLILIPSIHSLYVVYVCLSVRIHAQSCVCIYMYMQTYLNVWVAVCFHVCILTTVCSYMETRRQSWIIHKVNKSCTLFIQHRSLTGLGLPKDRNTSACHQVSRFFSHGFWTWDSGLMLPKQALYQLSPSTRKKAQITSQGFHAYEPNLNVTTSQVPTPHCHHTEGEISAYKFGMASTSRTQQQTRDRETEPTVYGVCCRVLILSVVLLMASLGVKNVATFT